MFVMNRYTIWLVARLRNMGWDQAPDVSVSVQAHTMDEAIDIAEQLTGLRLIAAEWVA